MTRYPLQKGIPIPPKPPRSHRARGFPWHYMEVGDSFNVADYSYFQGYNAINGIERICRKTYTVRKVKGGVRIWRTS